MHTVGPQATLRVLTLTTRSDAALGCRSCPIPVKATRHRTGLASSAADRTDTYWPWRPRVRCGCLRETSGRCRFALVLTITLPRFMASNPSPAPSSEPPGPPQPPASMPASSTSGEWENTAFDLPLRPLLSISAAAGGQKALPPLPRRGIHHRDICGTKMP